MGFIIFILSLQSISSGFLRAPQQRHLARNNGISEKEDNAMDKKADGKIHLLKPGEVDAWLQFLAEAFAKKGPNMLEVFQKKLNNDTDFHCGDVLLLGTLFDIIQVTGTCAITENTIGCWVSTVHVSRKEMWLNGTCEKLAGIANVATSPAHLRQGYALYVMNCALPHAEYVLGAKIAGLHCSRSQLWPFYEKCGYIHVPLQEDHVTVTLPPLQHQQDHVIHECHFTDTELGQMAELHKNYYNKFTGTLYRSKEYWNIVPKVVEGMRFGCVYTTGTAVEGNYPHSMLAYMGIRLISKHGGNIKVEIVEYAGSHEPGFHDNELFVPLLCHVIQRVCHYKPGDHVNLMYPSLMCNRTWFAAITTKIETQLHYGFMYRYTGCHDSQDILKLFDKFLFLYIDRF